MNEDVQPHKEITHTNCLHHHTSKNEKVTSPLHLKIIRCIFTTHIVSRLKT